MSRGYILKCALSVYEQLKKVLLAIRVCFEKPVFKLLHHPAYYPDSSPKPKQEKYYLKVSKFTSTEQIILFYQ